MKMSTASLFSRYSTHGGYVESKRVFFTSDHLFVFAFLLTFHCSLIYRLLPFAFQGAQIEEVWIMLRA